MSSVWNANPSTDPAQNSVKLTPYVSKCLSCTENHFFPVKTCQKLSSNQGQYPSPASLLFLGKEPKRTGQGKVRQDRAGQGRAGQGKAWQGKAWQGRAGIYHKSPEYWDS